ncbi:MAG TPA: hypothetical protein VGK89_13340 [Candidatus Eisenbacteria bacterium]|jgi:hypothetical protein
MRRAGALGAAALLAAAAMTSCAPHVVAPPVLDPLESAARYRAGSGARQALATAADAEASAWVSGEALGDLPGVHARLALGAPDAFRVRVESLFGTAVDLAARGESLSCFVPSRRLGVALDAVADTLGLRSPGSLGCRVLAATWDPPAAAWREARVEGGVLVARWQEEGDSLALGVGPDGLPRWVELHRPRGREVRALYGGWEMVERARWPTRLDVESAGAGLKLTLRLARVQRNLRPGPERLAVRIPPDAKRLEWSALRSALGRARGL